MASESVNGETISTVTDANGHKGIQIEAPIGPNGNVPAKVLSFVENTPDDAFATIEESTIDQRSALDALTDPLIGYTPALDDEFRNLADDDFLAIKPAVIALTEWFNGLSLSPAVTSSVQDQLNQIDLLETPLPSSTYASQSLDTASSRINEISSIEEHIVTQIAADLVVKGNALPPLPDIQIAVPNTRAPATPVSITQAGPIASQSLPNVPPNPNGTPVIIPVAPSVLPPNNGMTVTPNDEVSDNVIAALKLAGASQIASGYQFVIDLGHLGADYINLAAAKANGQTDSAFLNQTVTDTGALLGDYLGTLIPSIPAPATYIAKSNGVPTPASIVKNFAVYATQQAAGLVGAAFEHQSAIERAAFDTTTGIVEPVANPNANSRLQLPQIRNGNPPASVISAPQPPTGYILQPPISGAYISAQGALFVNGSAIPAVNGNTTTNKEFDQQINGDGTYTVSATTISADIANVMISFINNQSVTVPGDHEVTKLVLDVTAYENDPAQNPSGDVGAISSLVAAMLGGSQSVRADLIGSISVELKQPTTANGADGLIDLINDKVLISQAGPGSFLSHIEHPPIGTVNV